MNRSKTTIAAPALAMSITSGSRGSMTGSVVVVVVVSVPVVVVVVVVVVVDESTVTNTVSPLLLPELS